MIDSTLKEIEQAVEIKHLKNQRIVALKIFRDLLHDVLSGSREGKRIIRETISILEIPSEMDKREAARMSSHYNKYNQICSRCHTWQSKENYNLDTTICDDCIIIKPKGQQTKKKKEYDPEEAKYCDCWGGGGLYH